MKEQMEFTSLVEEPLGVLDYIVGGICGGGVQTLTILKQLLMVKIDYRLSCEK